jgi:hypothetical protein
MEDSIEGRSQELSAAVALSVCQKCKANVRFPDAFLDVHQNLVVHRGALSEPQAQDRPALFSLD